METFNIMEVLQFIHKMNKGCEIGIYYQGQSEPEVINISADEISGISFFPDYFKVDDSTVIRYDIISYIATDGYVWNKENNNFILC